jgi:hypothetical protein
MDTFWLWGVASTDGAVSSHAAAQFVLHVDKMKGLLVQFHY